MKKNVFIISTEYHFIETISYIVDRFYNGEYDNYVYYVVPYDSKRIDRFNIRYECIPASFKIIKYDLGSKYEKEFKGSLNELIELRPDRLFFFDEGHYWIPYLIKRMRRMGCTICMGPDGSNAYQNEDLKFDYIIRYIYKFLIFIYSHRLLPPFFPRIKRHHYAYTPGIDELWMEFPEGFNNYYCKKIVKQPVLKSEESKNLVYQTFNYNPDENSKEWEDSILLIDNPFGNRAADKMMEIIYDVKKRYPNYRLYVKAHPGTSQYAIDRYKEIEGITFLANNYPAELYILSFKHSIILSVYSTSMLCNNPECRFYWLYPMFYGYFDESYNMDNLTNPTTHITEVANANVIEI